MPHLVWVPRGRDVAATGLAGLFRAIAAPVYYPMKWSLRGSRNYLKLTWAMTVLTGKAIVWASHMVGRVAAWTSPAVAVGFREWRESIRRWASSGPATTWTSGSAATARPPRTP